MKEKLTAESPKPNFVIRVHLTDGLVESFAQADAAEAQKIWDAVEPSRLFAQQRLVIAGTHSKSVFVSAHILRVDFVQDTFDCWQFPGGYSDVVELTEEEFRERAHLDAPELMVKREQHTPTGDLLVSFLKLHMVGGKSIFLMVELPVKLPAENQSFMRFMLSKGGAHMRLACGGYGIINLANLVGYSVYPGVAQVPADAWLAEPFISNVG